MTGSGWVQWCSSWELVKAYDRFRWLKLCVAVVMLIRGSGDSFGEGGFAGEVSSSGGARSIGAAAYFCSTNLAEMSME